MATSLWNLLGEYKVVTPILQRDYAQGRSSGKVTVIRDRFLHALSNALNNNSTQLELDFVYGYTKENQHNSSFPVKTFVPLDGQQRLTTLFLLHWYIAVRENHLQEAEPLLSRFTYETRHSSRVFCMDLVKFMPHNLDTLISKTIINQPWFFTGWKNDPTISSMLTMLDAIQEMVNKNHLHKVWQNLVSENPAVVFHLLPMEKLGLPDDLYIKMNSRGKELTPFEHFKSRFSEILDPERALVFNNKIDQEWSDLFWDLYKDENHSDIAKVVDDAFLRFFRYITDILIAKQEIDTGSHYDEFISIQTVYKDTESVDYLFTCLDTFCSAKSNDPDFFTAIFYTEESDFSVEKTRLFFQNSQKDLFKKCAGYYDLSKQSNPFSIGEQLMLYACMVHKINHTQDFNTRTRKIRNLITNSEDNLRKEYMQSLLHTISEIIQNDIIDEDSKFNKRQAEEEELKQQILEKNSILKETFYKLEDHYLLQGCLAIFTLEDNLAEYTGVFHQVFTENCDFDLIRRALLCFGDYSQSDSEWVRRMRFGNRNAAVWRDFFSPSQRKTGFSKTHQVLYDLLSELILNPDSTPLEIIAEYLEGFNTKPDETRNWAYYFIKYKEFREKCVDGYYWWSDVSKKYESILFHKKTFNGFNWDPFLLTLKTKFENQVNLDNYASPGLIPIPAPLILIKDNTTIIIRNIETGYKIEANDEDSKELLQKIRKLYDINADDVLEIAQNQEGLDMEDRIEKGVELISKIIAF